MFLRNIQNRNFCLLGVSPISKYVVTAVLNAATNLKAPIIFIASLNQINVDGGYTGWTPKQFSEYINNYMKNLHENNTLIFLQLDHGGPWLRDEHLLKNLSYEEAVDDFLKSLNEFIKAGFSLIHIDTTIDLNKPDRNAEPDVAAYRTVELIEYSEDMAKQHGVDIGYEIGSDRWGYKSPEIIDKFIELTMSRLKSRGINIEKIVFGVADVGTEVVPYNKANLLIISTFSKIMQKHNIYLKIHSGDYLTHLEYLILENVGGINVGPMFAHTMYSTFKRIIFENLEKELANELITKLNTIIASADRLRKYLIDINKVEEYKLGLASRYIWSKNELEIFLNDVNKHLGFDIRNHLVKSLEEEVYRYFIRLGLHRII